VADRRLRLGVAVLIDPPAGDEIDGLRRALGSGSLGRIPPHVTLVPPVNVPSHRLGTALSVLRRAAATCRGPLRLTLGPVATFAPANPVLHLPVGGDLEGLRELRAAVFVPPLARTPTWAWVPHVTVAEEAEPGRIATAVAALDRYAVTVSIDRVVLLVERSDPGEGRRWRPLADAALGPASVVGRGGLPLELVRGRVVDPEAAALADQAGVAPHEQAGVAPHEQAGVAPHEQAGGPPLAGAAGTDGRPDPRPLAGARTEAGEPPDARPVAGAARSGDQRVLVVTARREGAVAGVAGAWIDDRGGHVGVFVDPSVRGQGVGTHLLAAVESAVNDAGWDCGTLAARGPAEFYRRRSRRSVAG